MRKVILTTNENQKYQIIKKLVDSSGNKKTATLKIGCSMRRINRIIVVYNQLGYACKQLGIGIRTSSIPQAKGRVERMFNPLQSCLPIELRLDNVYSIEKSNVFLNY